MIDERMRAKTINEGNGGHGSVFLHRPSDFRYFLEAHFTVLKQARYELALLDTFDLLLGQRLLGALHDLTRLVLPGNGLGALLATNANLVDFRDALAAVKLGMALLGVVLKHDGFY